MANDENKEVTLSAGSMYDLNKSLILQHEKKLIGQSLANKFQSTVAPYFDTRGNGYYMLLCHEQRDYTVFAWFKNITSEILQRELKECLLNRGDIYAIEPTEDGVALEIWLYSNNEMLCYYLFPYDQGVIEV